MARREKLYRRIPGTGYKLQLYTRLWLGPDHLLWVESTGFSERYKRFYYRDIQAIQIQRNKTGLWMTIILGILVLVPLLIALAVNSNIARGVWLVITGLFAIPFLIHLLLGPTCTCLLHTAVQTEKIASLGRLRRARRVLPRLRERIASAQGSVTRDEVLNRLAPTASSPGDIWTNPASPEIT